MFYRTGDEKGIGAKRGEEGGWRTAAPEGRMPDGIPLEVDSGVPETTSTGIKLWLTPHSSEHWP